MLRNFYHSSAKRRGFTLIELAIVLAITSLLTAGIWRMMSSGQSQLRDQAAADQHKQLINGIRAYLASTTGQSALYTNATGFNVSLSNATVLSYLPSGFSATTTNSYGQIYQVQVAKTPTTASTTPTSYSFMIKTVNSASGESIPDSSGGRIASMIGSDGGFVYNSTVCGTAGTTACGAFGTWAATPTDTTTYKFSSVAAGQVASRTFVGTSAETNAPWLARVDMDTSSTTTHELNKLSTSIGLNDQALYGTVYGGSYGGSIIDIETMTLEDIDGASLTVNSGSSCGKNAPTDNKNYSTGGCPDVAAFNGDVSVTGLLSAAKLYAQQFVYDTSDIRLKHDIVPLTNVLDKMAQIKGYSFKMNNGDEEKNGVIAQELEKIYPILVHDIGDGYKGVDYLGLIGPLVAAVNELRTQNEALQATVAAQGKKIEALEKKRK